MENTDIWQEHVKFAKEMQVPKTLLIENGDIVKLLPGNSSRNN